MQTLLTHQRRPDLTLHPGGRIDIAARVTRLLGLRPGDAIDVATENGEFYLYVRHRATRPNEPRYEATVFPTKRGGRNMRTHSRRITAALLRQCHATTPARLLCGELITRGDTDYLTIITHPLT